MAGGEENKGSARGLQGGDGKLDTRMVRGGERVAGCGRSETKVMGGASKPAEESGGRRPERMLLAVDMFTSSSYRVPSSPLIYSL